MYTFRLNLMSPTPPIPYTRGSLSALVIQVDSVRAASCYGVDLTAGPLQPSNLGANFTDGMWFRPSVPWTGRDPMGIPVPVNIGGWEGGVEG